MAAESDGNSAKNFSQQLRDSLNSDRVTLKSAQEEEAKTKMTSAASIKNKAGTELSKPPSVGAQRQNKVPL